MDVYQKLTILTFVTSTLTLILVAVAVLPHVKQGMVVIRDAILWAAFVLAVAVAGWAGWQRVSERLSPPQNRQVDLSTPPHAQQAVVTHAAATTAPDPYYRSPSSN